MTGEVSSCCCLDGAMRGKDRERSLLILSGFCWGCCPGAIVRNHETLWFCRSGRRNQAGVVDACMGAIAGGLGSVCLCGVTRRVGRGVGRGAVAFSGRVQSMSRRWYLSSGLDKQQRTATSVRGVVMEEERGGGRTGEVVWRMTGETGAHESSQSETGCRGDGKK